MIEDTPPQSNRFIAFLGSELFIGSLVAILSMLTAIAAYQAWRQEDISGDAEVKAIKALTESNTEYISANQEIIYDFQMYDGYYLAEVDSETEGYYIDNFSDYLTDSIQRPDGPFDDAYYDDHFAKADQLYDESAALFEQGEQAGEIADGYQITMLIYAVGLSLAAWGSLATERTLIRSLFGLLSAVAFIFGSYLLINVLILNAA